MYDLRAAESDADSAGSEDKSKSCTVCTQEDVKTIGFNALFFFNCFSSLSLNIGLRVELIICCNFVLLDGCGPYQHEWIVLKFVDLLIVSSLSCRCLTTYWSV